MRHVGIGLAVVLALSAAYIAFYWLVYHTHTGIIYLNPYESDYMLRSPRLRPLVASIFAPAQGVELTWLEAEQRRYLAGEWICKSEPGRAKIDGNFSIKLWGFSDEGIVDGVPLESAWLGNGWRCVWNSTNTKYRLQFVVEHEDHDQLCIRLNSKQRERVDGLDFRRVRSQRNK